MSRQDKATSESHTRTLRDLVKRPENKVCADCKRNDPRWASWNLGVFLCIRCSGIHRSMGTHISKVKSVDLDIWTPEQMNSIQQWGNARANLYWEAHLKPGHIPAEHKMESFIRSKYESRRWALEGPPPRDPSVLENAREHYSEPGPPSPPAQPSMRSSAVAPPQDTRRQARSLISAQARSKAEPQVKSPAAPPAPSVPVAAPQDDLFSLDFHAPATSTTGVPSATNGQKKDVKNDILSLFAASPPPGAGVFGGGNNLGVAQAQAQQMPPQSTSMIGNTGTGMWGVQSGWNGTRTGQPAQDNAWGQPQQQPFGAFGAAQQPKSSGSFTAQNVWGGDSSTATGSAGGDLFSTPFSSAAPPQAAKKDDAFGDLWGGFK